MKTKIIYISGNEIFDMADIRAAFEEVRIALNLDKDTVLFGVPVDAEDAGLCTTENDSKTNEEIIPQPIIDSVEEETIIPEEPIQIIEDIEHEEVVEEPVKKRGRPRKVVVPEDTEEEIIESVEPETNDSAEEKIVPILSVLGGQEETVEQEIEIIPDDEIKAETSDVIEDIEPETLTEEIPEQEETHEEDEADLEKLLSAITPLQEDFMEETPTETHEETVPETEDNIDATLEQLATEFVASQDKIKEEEKSSGRSKIGKLRNILPFKQSKNKDTQGLGDLFGWAGIAANDEDFSVPGFFTNAAAKK